MTASFVGVAENPRHLAMHRLPPLLPIPWSSVQSALVPPHLFGILQEARTGALPIHAHQVSPVPPRLSVHSALEHPRPSAPVCPRVV